MPPADESEIFETVKSILEGFVDASVCIETQTEFVKDFGLDSIRVMEIVEKVEDAFDISFPLNSLPRIRTVEDFVAQIHQELEGKGHGAL